MSEPFVHPSSVVDDDVTLGAGTRVWHFGHLCGGARIGARCVLGQNVYVGPGVVIGDGVKIQNNVSVYAGVEIEDDVFLGPSCVFTNVLRPRASIERKHELARTVVRRGATVGANATIVCGRDVGAYALIGAGAVVTREVAPHALVLGNPGRRHGWVCRCGQTLPERETTADCPDCGRAYRLDGGACRLWEEG